MKRFSQTFTRQWVRYTGWIIFSLIAMFAACTNDIQDGSPVGPSRTVVQVIPSNVNVNQGDTLTFSAVGGSTPYSWTISATSIGSIIASTGVFTATNTTGTATITAQDAVGDTGTATVNVVILATALTVTPFNVQVNKGDTLTFVASGGSAPYSYSLSATSIGNIVASTGDFTASTIAGSATVTAIDSRGISGTATVTVLADTLIFTPAAVVANTATSTIFNVSGGTGAFIFTLANDNTSSTFTLPTMTTTATTATVVYTVPTALQGNQVFTLTARDTGNGDIATAKLTLLAP
jgi:plastocyanin